jgi:hypothetical protein
VYRVLNMMLAGFMASMAAFLVRRCMGDIASVRITAMMELIAMIGTFFCIYRFLNRLRE